MSRKDLLTRRYGSVAGPYDDVWAPPLIAFSEPLVGALAIEAGARVADLGAGTGALAERLGATCVDRTVEMLGVAVRRGLACVAGDMRRLPLTAGSFDVAISTFALQHVPTPGVVAREAYRILRQGGRFATATWSTDHGEQGGVYDLLAEVFASVPAESAAMTTWHDRVDSPEKMTRHMRRGGFGDVRAWMEPRTYTWEPEAFHRWATTMGPYGRRFGLLPARKREQVVEALLRAVRSAPRADREWNPTIVYCIATA